MEIKYQQEFKTFLYRELRGRIERNPKYSLRAFARDLELSPSRVSEILNGKQGMSPQAAKKVVGKLTLSETEQARFCQLAAFLHSRSLGARQIAFEKLQAEPKDFVLEQIKEDSLEYISQWYHVAINELAYLDNFTLTAENIAKALGISKVESEQAIERMIRLKILKRVKNKVLPINQSFIVPGGAPSSVIKKSHEQFLDKAKNALYLQSVAQREFITVVFSSDGEQLERLKTMMQEFAKELLATANKSKKKQKIFSYCMQLFHLTEPNYEN